MRAWPLIATSVALFASAAAAHGYTAGPLTVDHPWARTTAGSARTAAVYLTVGNSGAAPDRLVAVAMPEVAERAELHSSRLGPDNVMRMEAVDGIEVAANRTVRLQPGEGFHVMLSGLKRPLAQGERLPLVLTFAQAGAVTVEVAIDKAGAPTPAHAGHGE